MPEQKMALQARMIEAYEAKVKAYAERKVADQLALIDNLNLGRQKMIEAWQGIWPDLMPLIPTAEEIIGNDDMVNHIADNPNPPLILEYEGIILKIADIGGEQVRLYYWGSTETRVFTKHADIAQEIWAYFGKRLVEQADSFNEEFDFEDKVEPVMDAVWWELKSAYAKHGDINSLHEGYAVIDEERLELRDEVRKTKNSKVLSPDAIKELVQIAAMAIRTLIDLKAEIA